MRHRFAFLLLAFLPPLFACLSLSGQVVNFKGKLLEYADNQWSPMKGVPVKVVSYGSKLTDDKGSFSVNVKPDAKLLKIEIDLSNHKMAAPFEGTFGMPLPPGDQAEIILLRQTEDKPICDEVDKLHAELRQLKKGNRLEINRLNAINRAMLDTIQALRQREIQHRANIETLKNEVARAVNERDALQLRLEKLVAENERLRAANDSLIGVILRENEEKYLRQQALFEEITAALQDYFDRLKDFQKALTVLVPAYFDPRQPDAAGYYNESLAAYNAAWKLLSLQHQRFILAVRQDWADESVADELAATCRFLLDDIHKTRLLPMDEEPGVNFYLRNRKAGKAQQSAEKLHGDIEPLATELEQKIQSLRQKLQSHI